MVVLMAVLGACSDDDNDPSMSATDGGPDAAGQTRDSAANVEPADASTIETRSADTSTASSDAGGDAAQAMAMFTAANGGTLSLSGAKLVALSGALSDDTLITVTESPPTSAWPNTADIIGMVYAFTLRPIVSAGPLELLLPVDGAALGNKPWTIAGYDESAKTWVAVPTKWFPQDAQASALVTRVTAYAIVLGTPGSAGPAGNAASVCPATGNCGGTLTGTYRTTSSCSNADPLSVAEPCSGGSAVVTTTTTRTGTISFLETTFEELATEAAKTDVRTDGVCTAALKTAGSTSCASAAGRLVADRTWTCSGSMDTRCHCAGVAAAEAQARSGTFFTANGKLTLMAAGAPGPPPALNYCISGNAVTFREAKGSVRTAVKQL